MNTKNHAPKAPASQLAGKTVNAIKTAPESTFGQFVLGDIKGGSAAHEYRMSVVATAVREALKGNSRALIEASKIASGKSKKAKAYADGFQAVGIPARVVYSGKLSDPANAAIVAQIDMTTAALAADFELAFLTRLHAPAETETKATKSKATKATDTDTDTAAAAAAAPTVEMDAADLFQAAIDAITSGLATDAEVEAMLGAITARRMTAAALATAAETVAA